MCKIRVEGKKWPVKTTERWSPNLVDIIILIILIWDRYCLGLIMAPKGQKFSSARKYTWLLIASPRSLHGATICCWLCALVLIRLRVYLNHLLTHLLTKHYYGWSDYSGLCVGLCVLCVVSSNQLDVLLSYAGWCCWPAAEGGKVLWSSAATASSPPLFNINTFSIYLPTCSYTTCAYRVWNVLVFTIFIMSFSAWKCLTLRNRWKQDATLHWRPTRHILISTDISINYALLTTNPMISKRIHTKKTKNQDPNYPQIHPWKLAIGMCIWLCTTVIVTNRYTPSSVNHQSTDAISISGVWNTLRMYHLSHRRSLKVGRLHWLAPSSR